MVCALSLSLLLLVQGGWRVEETRLAPPGWLIEDVTDVNEDIVAVSAFRSSDGGTQATDFALIYARGGEDPEIVRTSRTPIRFARGSGTGFTFVVSSDAGVGDEFFRRRPTGEIVSLGRFDTEPRAITCDDAVTDCVMIADGDNAEAKRWRSGVFSGLPNMPPNEASLFAPQGAAMHPDGGLAALWLEGAVAVMALDTGRVTVVFSRELFKRDSLKTFVEWVIREENERERSHDCRPVPTGWSGGNPTIELVSHNAEFGGICEIKPNRFELELKTGKRKPLPAYPWSLLESECPTAGWASSVGTLMTDCTRLNDALPSALPPTTPQVPPRDLPEAIALSPTELFVMEPTPKHPYRWYRGRPKGKGLTFIVDGPSVLTFKAKGIEVEQVTWPFGTAVFLISMADDWHVIKTQTDAWAFVRLARIQ